jgi:hypothetical protein
VLAIGDGALGFWGALREVFPDSREQRCWVHYADLRIMPTPRRFQFRFSQIGRHNQRGSAQTDPLEIATVWRAWPSCARLERWRYRALGTVPRPTETVKIMPTCSAPSQFGGPALSA